jgi:hypothetical protein
MGLLKKMMPAVAKAAKAAGMGAVGNAAVKAKPRGMIGALEVVGMKTPSTTAPKGKAKGPIGRLMQSKTPAFKNGGSAMKSSDAMGRAVKRKTADVKGRAMKKGK